VTIRTSSGVAILALGQVWVSFDVMERNSEDYLTEKRLGEILDAVLPEHDFIHDKAVPKAKNNRRRPDYRSEKLRLILEFDGDTHYTQSKRILTDKEKDEDYKALGYRIFRIPYFIQITPELLKEFFGSDFTYQQKYPHGFIDPKAVLPADYCELGIEAFKADLQRFEAYKTEILNSLKEKTEELKNPDLVLPRSIQSLIPNHNQSLLDNA